MNNLETQWGKTLGEIRQAGPRIDMEAFDKPGKYFLGEYEVVGGYKYACYLRADEIAEGVKNLKEYIDDLKKHNDLLKKDLPTKGPKFQAWAKFMRPEDIPAKVEEIDETIENLKKVKSLKDVAANVTYSEGPAFIDGKPILLGNRSTLKDRASRRQNIVWQVGQAGPTAIVRMSELGVILEGKENWAAEAQKAISGKAFLQRAYTSLKGEVSSMQAETRLKAIKRINEVLADFVKKYPKQTVPSAEIWATELLQTR